MNTEFELAVVWMMIKNHKLRTSYSLERILWKSGYVDSVYDLLVNLEGVGLLKSEGGDRGFRQFTPTRDGEAKARNLSTQDILQILKKYKPKVDHSHISRIFR